MTARHLVLGAGGFLGGRLVRRLAADRATVRGFGRPPRHADADAPAVEFVAGDLEDDAALSRALEGVQVVHHLLGAATPAAASAEFDRSEGERIDALLRLAVMRGVATVVFASSGGPLYGPDAPLPTPESAPRRPVTPYGRTKLLVEEALERARDGGLRTVSLRIANAYGPGQAPSRGQGLVATAIARTLAGEALDVWGDGSARRDYVHADDVAGAFARAAAYGGDRTAFNIASGVGRSVREVVADVARALDRPEPPLRLSPGRSADVPVSVLDPRLALSELGWRGRRDWRESLRTTADWIRAQPAATSPPPIPRLRT